MNSSLVDLLTRINIITKNGTLNKQSARILDKHPSIKHQVIQATSFLDNDAGIRARLYAIRNDITSLPTCGSCGTPMSFNDQLNRFNRFCENKKGSSCAKNDPQVEAKRIQTLKDRYGVDNPMKNPTLKQKAFETMVVKYGVNTPMKNSDIKSKAKQTLVDRYGVESISNIPGVSEKRAETNTSRYGSKTYAESLVTKSAIVQLSNKMWLSDRLIDFTISEIADEINTSVHTVRKAISYHNLRDYITNKTSSSQHREITRYLDSLGIEYEINNRTLISPKEIDIYIPSAKLGIEFNGVFYHSELSGKDRRYHRDKRISCVNQDVKLIQIWSNEWDTKQDIVKSRIAGLVKVNNRIPARQCEIRELSSVNERVFFDTCHIQGGRSGTVAYGLFFNDKLVAAMNFIKSRFTDKYEWELLRFCSALNTNVVGGASKLFNHFVKVHNPLSLVSYCDYRWGDGAVYHAMGFKHTHDADPNYFYFVRNGNTNKLMSRQIFQKHKLPKILNVFDVSKTEWQNMVDNGYDRIWDCGNGVFVWTPTT